MVGTAMRLTESDARAIVELAELAPSIHNTQPWRWRLDAAGLHLFADPARLLQVADPEGRQLLISCGASLAFARLAARSRGLLVDAVLGPFADDETGVPAADQPLATLTVSGRRPASPAEADLVAAMATRHTDRRPFLAGDRGRLTSDDLSALRHAAEAESAWAWFVDDTDSRIETSVLLSRADWHEAHDPAYAAELRQWRHEPSVAADGIPSSAVPDVAGERQSEFVLRDFGVDGGNDASGATGVAGGGLAGGGTASAAPGEGPVERPTVLVVGTDSDRPVDWLIAGGATGRVMLTATARGLAASPLGQVIDLTASRAQLGAVIGATGHAQMMLRLGRPDPALPPLAGTPRRGVDEILQIG
ncbi:nitroreductase [Frankia sp. R43]|uniref:Acg family FMN-binding oxidoreductase n=1 Tax=Frankia sp. R43 TaxID=269536 RepID=UPI0006CA105A|nr:hypothetical protein [Frankia sp. R43]KPM56468.1 nitroreductase [Frankia sp. R43]